MEIRATKKQIVEGLRLASGIADRKSTLPILANVLIRTDGDDQLTVAASDLNVSLTVSVPAKIKAGGGVTLEARRAHEIVKGLGGDEVHLKVDENSWAEIRSGRAEFKLVGMRDKDYPAMPQAPGEWSKVEAPVLLDLLVKAAFSVSGDDTRSHLAGVLFESDGKNATAVSTDGHRLSKITRGMAGGPKLYAGVIVPRKGVGELRRILEGRDGEVEIGIREGSEGSHLFLRADNVTLAVKLTQGQFPPYNQVIPKDNPHKVKVNRDDLLHAFQRVGIMAASSTMGVQLSVGDGKLVVQATNVELGNAREALEIDYRGTATAGFNARYYIELLTEMVCQDVALELGGELDPAVVRPGDGSDYLGVIMPMKL